jgi:hypothetical protein
MEKMKNRVGLSMKVVAVLCGAAFILNGCGLDRSGLNWPTDANPHYICPGETVTLSWNTHEGGCLGDGCPPPVQVHIASDPAEVLGGLLTVGDEGSRTIGPVNFDTTFTFTKTGGRESLPTKTNSVKLVQPPPIITDAELNFPATCTGASAAWEAADLSVPEFRSSAVRLLHICNYSRDEVSLSLNFTTGAVMSWTLLPSQCNPDLPIALGQSVQGAHVASLTPGRVECDTRASLPPEINLVASLVCDLMTTSSPLVYVPPTEVPTKSGIIILATQTATLTQTPTETPTSTPTSTPAASLSFGKPSLSTDHFYSGGGGCGVLDLKLQVGISDPNQVSSMVLFFHLKDKAGGASTPWNDGVAMHADGAGMYSYDLVSSTIPAFNSYPEAWLIYQFAAVGPGGSVLLRSPAYGDVTLTMCGKK